LPPPFLSQHNLSLALSLSLTLSLSLSPTHSLSLPLSLQDEGHRILIFSQWTKMLDILGALMEDMGLEFLRLDGSTPVRERQKLIDRFEKDRTIPIFILSTKAGGLGINLTAADTVILHDLDFNPENDRQAEVCLSLCLSLSHSSLDRIAVTESDRPKMSRSSSSWQRTQWMRSSLRPDRESNASPKLFWLTTRPPLQTRMALRLALR
jgi:hypothetical protein